MIFNTLIFKIQATTMIKILLHIYQVMEKAEQNKTKIHNINKIKLFLVNKLAWI